MSLFKEQYLQHCFQCRKLCSITRCENIIRLDQSLSYSTSQASTSSLLLLPGPPIQNLKRLIYVSVCVSTGSDRVDSASWESLSALMCVAWGLFSYPSFLTPQTMSSETCPLKNHQTEVQQVSNGRNEGRNRTGEGNKTTFRSSAAPQETKNPTVTPGNRFKDEEEILKREKKHERNQHLYQWGFYRKCEAGNFRDQLITNHVLMLGSMCCIFKLAYCSTPRLPMTVASTDKRRWDDDQSKEEEVAVNSLTWSDPHQLRITVNKKHCPLCVYTFNTAGSQSYKLHV